MLALIKGAILDPEKGLHLITETAPVFFLFDLQCGVWILNRVCLGAISALFIYSFLFFSVHPFFLQCLCDTLNKHVVRR